MSKEQATPDILANQARASGHSAQPGYWTLTGTVLSFAVYLGIGWVIGGRIGMGVGVALNLLRYAVAVGHAASPAAPPPRVEVVGRD